MPYQETNEIVELCEQAEVLENTATKYMLKALKSEPEACQVYFELARANHALLLKTRKTIETIERLKHD